MGALILINFDKIYEIYKILLQEAPEEVKTIGDCLNNIHRIIDCKTQKNLCLKDLYIVEKE